MKVLIRTNYYQLARTKHYDELHAERDELSLNPPSKCFARRIYPNLSIMKEVWCCSSTHFITKAIHTELKYIRIQCVEHLQRVHRWVRPLSQYIDRPPDAHIRQDASTIGGTGGGSGELKYWW